MAFALVLIVVGVVMGTLKGSAAAVTDQLEPSTLAGIVLALCGTVCTAVNGINMKKIWRNDREIRGAVELTDNSTAKSEGVETTVA
ncbi:hypothetical protein Pmar_PMAR017743 [Perkinsus marinus ATCC 50983]|uniref:Uncharacterized protein n=1 Tax=Perkinsus marinus (strain ATCC 50983 / TXsc) TaxID=423536 RepID=C5L3V6_PERM5|nr:hypothetical protein Pmar_PMAR017743 [Perkinsus marinus ATCC 50983]EER08685.1 hypothetical protein Pmar_PMAR017743 [Perkinsus marinus ATCC 50983]|eukprot:XP_002776869.1 hypothetical protein Pmar_PMAR017743 [Perkinsus marinus ATCC 50983]